MLKRKIYDKLIAWKQNKKHKCLILEGTRQVGKTYIIREFASNNYSEVVEINFKESPSAMEIFNGDLDVDTLITALKFRLPEIKFTPGKTLIFFDEIQECEEAITSLKFWTIDGRYDVVASGSLLGIDYKRASSYPVGYVEYIKMYGLDFEEFLWAMNVTEEMIATIAEHFYSCSPVPTAINTQLMNYFRNYIALGGMPEVVQNYTDTGDYREADRIQRYILQGYQYDIAHYASGEEKIKAEKCYMSLAKQLLNKENHKFQYKEIEHGGRAQKYFSSVEWLVRADIANVCKLVTDIRFDLEDYARDDFFRLYATDMSPLMAMRDFSLKREVVENTIEGNTKGGLYECAVADVLYKKGYKIYFYKNNSTKKEVDFLIQKDGDVIPIEVKSGNTRATSLNGILKKYPDLKLSYKLADSNIRIDDNGVITMPLYMAMFV